MNTTIGNGLVYIIPINIPYSICKTCSFSFIKWFNIGAGKLALLVKTLSYSAPS